MTRAVTVVLCLALAAAARADDPLPEGAVKRLGTTRLRHPGPVAALAFSPDGRLLRSHGYEGESLVWDVQTGARVERPDATRTFPADLAVSAPARRLLAAFLDGRTRLELRDAGTGQAVFTKPADTGWAAAAVSRDGKTLLALDCAHELRVWDIPAGRETARRAFPFVSRPSSAAYTPGPQLAADGSVLAGVKAGEWKGLGEGSRVHFWDPLTGKENRPAITLGAAVRGLELSADGKLLTVFYRSAKVQLWDTDTGKAVPLAHGEPLGDGFVLLPDRKRAVAVYDDWAYLANLETGKGGWVREITPYFATGPGLRRSTAVCAAVSPDGKTTAAGTNCGHITLLDTDTGEPVAASKAPPGFFAGPLRFHADGRTVVLNHGKRPVVWDLAGGKTLRDLEFESDDAFTSVSELSPDGRLLALSVWPGGKDENGKVWPGTALRVVETVSGREVGFHTRVNRRTVQFAADGKSLAFRDRTDAFRFAPIPGYARQVAPDPRRDLRVDYPGGVILSPDLRRAAVREKHALRLIDTETGTPLWNWEWPADWDAWPYTQVRFVPGKLIVSAGRWGVGEPADERLVVLDATNGRKLRGLRRWSFDEVAADGRHVAVSTCNEATEVSSYVVHDLETGQVVVVRERSSNSRGNGCAFSPDGRVFACVPDTGVVEFYDVRTGRRLTPPRAHWAYVRDLSFTPDGRALAVSYNDSSVLFWEVPRPGPGFR